MSHRWLVALAFVGVLAIPVRSEAQARPLWHTLDPGSHAVGFRRIWSEDASRIWPRSPAIDSVSGPVARPIRVDVWYPAETCMRGDRMRLGDYLEMDAPSPDFDDLVFLTHRWNEYSYRGLAPDSAAYDRLMSAETAACAGAVGSPGRFPLVVYSAGWFNRSPDNTVLAEYLASHGFVVAALPQVNPGLWTFDFTSDAPAIENQIRDMEMALALLRDDPAVDRRRIAAAGYSTGGDVALLLQNRNPLIRAVVGMDASWTLGPGDDVSNSDFFRPEWHGVPILVVRRPVDGDVADTVLDRLTAAPRVVVEIPGADHGTFSDDPVQRLYLGTGPEPPAETHTVMAEVILEFLTRALASGSGAFDGESLAGRLATRGLRARFLAAEAAGTGGF